MLDFLTLLRENPYPGRGILVSRDLVYYFIMGRSANSRNRIFVKTEDGIRTEAHDPAKLEDPSLIIYHPVRTMGDALVVTNGDQTDTICQHGDLRFFHSHDFSFAADAPIPFSAPEQYTSGYRGKAGQCVPGAVSLSTKQLFLRRQRSRRRHRRRSPLPSERRGPRRRSRG